MAGKSKIYWLEAVTPLHVGSGKGVGFIDMPIMREKVTNWPMVPGSAVKGVMRDYFTIHKDEKKIDINLINAAFGRASDDEFNDETSNAGSLILTDARIVCLPVRSLYGTFAYITSPLVLERLRRDLAATGFVDNQSPPSLACPENDEVLITSSPASKLVTEGKVFFEDMDFRAKQDVGVQKWAEELSKALFSVENSNNEKWQQIFKERFAVLSDDCFNFLCESGTEVAAHIRIDDDRKIVAKGALWYEEALPTESILAGIAWCDRIYGKACVKENEIFETFCPKAGLDLQIGGKATVGKGRVKCCFSGE